MSDTPRTRDTTDSILMVIGLVIAVILLAAVWREMKKSRASGEDKMVASNLRQLVQGAEQYFTEHNVSSVEFSALAGTNRSQFVKSIYTVAQETYSAVLWQSTAVTASGIAGARTVTYAP